MNKIGLVLVLCSALFIAPLAAQETRFEDELQKSTVRKGSFPALMEESLKSLYDLERYITGYSKTKDEETVEALLKKLNVFTFNQNIDDLTDDQNETLRLAKGTFKEVKTLFDHQLVTADTVEGVGFAHPMTIFNLIGRRAEIESQLASIRLKGLHYSHPGYGLNQAIKASYEAMSFVAFELEDKKTSIDPSVFVDQVTEINKGLSTGRFALNRWRFRASTKEEKDAQASLTTLADSYDVSFDVEDKVKKALEDSQPDDSLQGLLNVLVELEIARIEARDARLAIVQDKKS